MGNTPAIYSTSTSVSARALELECSYTTSDKAVKVDFTTHAYLGGIISCSEAFLTLNEATELVEELTAALAEAQKIAVQKAMAQL